MLADSLKSRLLGHELVNLFVRDYLSSEHQV